MALGVALSVVIVDGLATAGETTCAPPGTVVAQAKISSTEGGFSGPLAPYGYFGSAICLPGDIDGDGIGDLAVGAFTDSDGGPNRGAVWVLLLNPDGTVKSQQKISSAHGGFGGELSDWCEFGTSAASLGDLDGDGVPDIAVGVPRDDDGGEDVGAVWILFLNADGTVKTQQKISKTAGGLDAPLGIYDLFGNGICPFGDFDGDGISDIAVSSLGHGEGGTGNGTGRVLCLNPDGTVKSETTIPGSDTPSLDRFGTSVASLGDLDGDGARDLIIGAPWDDGGGIMLGALWVYLLNADATIKATQKITSNVGGFEGVLNGKANLGWSVSAAGDLNGDGVRDVVAGTPSDGYTGRVAGGKVWVLFMNVDGTVNGHQEISAVAGGFAGPLDDGDAFGSAVASDGALGADETVDVWVGAGRDDDGGVPGGAVWKLALSAGLFASLEFDLDDDCQVNGSDLATLLGAWGTGDEAADLNGNGIVDGEDLALLISAWTG